MKLPPVQGIPAKRPACAWCNRPLKYWTKETRAKRSCDVGNFASGDVTARAWEGWRGYPRWETPIFDTLRCALSFATAAHLGGYRRKTDATR